MKCDDINIISHIEGNADDETAAHIKACPHCRRLEVDIKKLFNEIIPKYATGKQIQLELEKELATINTKTMKPLPEDIAIMVKEMHKQRLVSCVQKAIGNAKKDAEELIENILCPQYQPLPASPKDIFREEKSKKGKKAATSKTVKKSRRK